jgi:hypothetical protein
MKGFRSIRKHCLVASVVLAAVAIPVPASAESQTPSDATPHCLLKINGKEVTDNNKMGTFTTEPMRCYATYAEVLRKAGPAVVADNIKATPAELLKPDALSKLNLLQADSVIGIHFEYANGTGATLTVSGSNCSGGGLNVPIAWNDRISSTLNGCPTIVHYENTNYALSSYSTYGAGSLQNITGYMDNKTSSILYY